MLSSTSSTFQSDISLQQAGSSTRLGQHMQDVWGTPLLSLADPLQGSSRTRLRPACPQPLFQQPRRQVRGSGRNTAAAVRSCSVLPWLKVKDACMHSPSAEAAYQMPELAVMGALMGAERPECNGFAPLAAHVCIAARASAGHTHNFMTSD